MGIFENIDIEWNKLVLIIFQNASQKVRVLLSIHVLVDSWKAW